MMIQRQKYRIVRIHKNIEFGFTMIELLVVVAIISILAVALFSSLVPQFQRGNDTTRKADFAKLKIAFENYYNDKGCYPPASILAQCNSHSALAPYLGTVPCDPITHKPYQYLVDASCNWYALFTNLSDSTDPSIPIAGCSPNCTIGGKNYNYVQTTLPIGTLLPIIGGSISTPPPNATPTPTPIPNMYACDPNGICNIYQDPTGSHCPVSFNTPNCNNSCGDPANRCPGSSSSGGGSQTGGNQQAP